MKPFLKWAGGKHSQLTQIESHLPRGRRLFEPFVGAGSVFMNMGFEENFINDVNPDLINLYSVLRHDGERLLREAKQLHEWCTSEDNYYRIRDRFNTREYSAYSMAAFFLVLNRTGFNGMCRYSADRNFNVPWGKNPTPYFPEEELRAYLDAGFSNQMFCTDFASMMSLARSGDVIFCDPPYHPMPGKQGFTTYSGATFGLGDQKRLVAMAVEAKKRGVPTVITNSAAPVIIDLYKANGFEIHPLLARRSVAASGESRGTIKDIIAILK